MSDARPRSDTGTVSAQVQTLLAQERAFTLAAVQAAANRAADEILAAVREVEHVDNEALTNAINFMVNASLDYLTGESLNLEQVALRNYTSEEPGKEVTLGEIVEWILNP